MRCLVTGATGHLGSSLTRLLLSRGHDVVVLARPHSDLWRIADVQSQTRVIRCDLSAVDRVSGELREIRPETVFHLAWLGVWHADVDQAAQIAANTIGSLRLLQIALDAGCACWIGTGSQAEYGPQAGPLHEELPARPVTTYGVTKLCVGLLSREACEAAGVRSVWLRLLATYGPRDDDARLIPTVITRLLHGQRPALTPGDQRWDYLYVDDAAAALHEAAISPRARGLFNLASGEVHRVREVAERIRDLIDPSLPLGFGELPYANGQTMRLEADVSRLRDATGWRPKVSLEEGLRATVEWYRARLGGKGVSPVNPAPPTREAAP